MKWGQDKLVDELIANNTARPRPGMDKPDAAMMTITRDVQKTRATPPAAPRPKVNPKTNPR